MAVARRVIPCLACARTRRERACCVWLYIESASRERTYIHISPRERNFFVTQDQIPFPSNKKGVIPGAVLGHSLGEFSAACSGNGGLALGAAHGASIAEELATLTASLEFFGGFENAHENCLCESESATRRKII